MDNGTTVTLSEIYCTGTSLYAGFVVESEKAFLDGLAFPGEFELEMKINSIGIKSDETVNGK